MHRLLTALVLCLSTAALADLTMVSETVSGGKTRTVTLSTKANKAYFELQEADAPLRTMMRDADSKQLFLVDHAKKVITVITEADSKALELKQAQFRAQMQAQLEKMAPEQRARAESTMLGVGLAEAKPAVFTFDKKKGAARKVNGFSCQDYVIKREGKVHGEGCFMTWKDTGLTADEFKATMLRAMPTGATSGPMAGAFEGQASAPGFPVYRKLVDDTGAVTSETTLKSLTKTALGADKFELPRDYTQRSVGAVMGGPARKE